mgnify:CR=1 FL=1
MELLFSNHPTHTLALPRYYAPPSTILAPAAPASPPAPLDPGPEDEAVQETDVRFLVWWLREYVLEDRERPELFSQGDTVCVPLPPSPPLALQPAQTTSADVVHPRSRPGILVLINSTDWELEGELDYVLQDRDEVVFISTLHGG